MIGFDNNGFILGIKSLKTIHPSMELVNLGLLTLLNIQKLRNHILLLKYDQKHRLKEKKRLYYLIVNIFKKYNNEQSFKSNLSAWELYDYLNENSSNLGFPWNSPLNFIFLLIDKIIFELKKMIKKSQKNKNKNQNMINEWQSSLKLFENLFKGIIHITRKNHSLFDDNKVENTIVRIFK